MKKTAFALITLALLTACSSTEPARVQTNLGATSKISLDVSSVTLTDRSGIQPSDSPYNTGHFQPTIAEAIKQWSTDHLRAVGTGGEAIVIIKDATLTSQAIPHGHDWFTREQTTKYSAHAEVELEIKGHGDSYALASAQASRYETLPENPSETERQNAYTTLLNGLIKDLSQSLDSSIQDHLQHFVVTAPAP
jgi:hypothetical protein